MALINFGQYNPSEDWLNQFNQPTESTQFNQNDLFAPIGSYAENGYEQPAQEQPIQEQLVQYAAEKPFITTTVGQNPHITTTAGGNSGSQTNSVDPQLQAIIDAIKNTPGASGSIGGQSYNNTTANTQNNTGPQNTSQYNYLGGPANPYQTNVSMDYANNLGSGTYQSAPDNPNFVTKEAGEHMAKLFGGNLVQSTPRMGAGIPTMYGLDFGAGDVQDIGWMYQAAKLGQSPAEIMARLKAGIAPPLGIADRSGSELNWDVANPLLRNLQQGQVSSIVPGATSQNIGSSPTGLFKDVQAATHLGPLGGARPAGQRAIPPNFGAAGGGTVPSGGGQGFWGGSGGGLPNGGWLSGGGNNFGGGGSFQPSTGGFQPGTMSGFASAINNAQNFRRPFLPYQGGGYMNRWYYPGSEPNFRGGPITYGGGNFRPSPRFGNSQYRFF